MVSVPPAVPMVGVPPAVPMVVILFPDYIPRWVILFPDYIPRWVYSSWFMPGIPSQRAVLHKDLSFLHGERREINVAEVLNPKGIQGLGTHLRITLTLGETPMECSRIPLQKAPLYKEVQKGKRSFLLIKTVNVINLRNVDKPGSGPYERDYSHCSTPREDPPRGINPGEYPGI